MGRRLELCGEVGGHVGQNLFAEVAELEHVDEGRPLAVGKVQVGLGLIRY
jgi:hypothetical protein